MKFPKCALFLIFSLNSCLSQAWECIPPTYKVDQKIAAAKHIFVGRVMKAWIEEDLHTIAPDTAKESELTKLKYYRYFAEYQLIKQVRGSPAEIGVLESSQEPFRVELIPGYVYLVMLQDSNETGTCEGTVRLDNWDRRRLEVTESNLKDVISTYASWTGEITVEYE